MVEVKKNRILIPPLTWFTEIDNMADGSHIMHNKRVTRGTKDLFNNNIHFKRDMYLKKNLT